MLATECHSFNLSIIKIAIYEWTQLDVANQLTLTDQEILLDEQTIAATKRLLSDHREQLLSRLKISNLVFDDRLGNFAPNYLINPAPSDFAENSFDVVYSRAVLEHVPPDIIMALSRGYEHKLKRSGVFIHLIDNSDHFEHQDKSINRVNFLKYSKRQWWWATINPQNYQNRLRHSQYRALFNRLGYQVIGEDRFVCPKALASVPLLKMHDDFSGLCADDLATMESLFVMRPQRN